MSKYRADIDGLRAIAIALVVVFHFDVFSIGKAGFIGVDIFFVISGFLITGILKRDLTAGKFSLRRFLYRRVRRLYPALLTTLTLYLAVGTALLLPDQLEELARETLLSNLYVINFYLWQSVDYFGLQSGSVPLLHMWSLAIEEQFYLLFPIFCLIVFRLRPRWLLGSIVAATLASFVLGLLASSWQPVAAFYLLPTRAWELLLGAVLALAVQRKTPQGPWLAGCTPLGLGLIALALVLHTPVTPVPGWYALLPTLGAALIIFGGFRAQSAMTRALSTPVMVWIGKISYPLYLVHWPILILLRENLPELSLPVRLAGLAGSVVMGWAIYRWVESPLRHGGVMPGERQFLTVTAALTATTIVTSAYIMRQEGLPGRFSADVARALAHRYDEPEIYQRCSYDEGQSLAQMCRLGRPDGTAHTLIIGDSHGRALAGAFDAWLEHSGRTAAFAFLHACPVLRDVGRPGCVSFTDAALAAAAEDPEITEVIIVSIWRYAFEGDGLVVGGRFVSSPEAETAFATALESTVEALAAAGVRVTLIEPMFTARRAVPRTLAGNLAFGRDWSVDRPLADHLSEYASVFTALARAEAAGARRVSLLGAFCSDGLCRATWEGRPLFSDTNHLAFGMSHDVARILAEVMPPPPPPPPPPPSP